MVKKPDAERFMLRAYIHFANVGDDSLSLIAMKFFRDCGIQFSTVGVRNIIRRLEVTDAVELKDGRMIVTIVDKENPLKVKVLMCSRNPWNINVCC